MGRIVSEEIRAEIISRYASAVSTLAPVREYLLELQRGLARDHDVIMDGRDIGTVILPHAQVKIFLDCLRRKSGPGAVTKSCWKRARPWNTTRVCRDSLARDEKDTSRAAAPLKPAADAVQLEQHRLYLGRDVGTHENHHRGEDAKCSITSLFMWSM